MKPIQIIIAVIFLALCTSYSYAFDTIDSDRCVVKQVTGYMRKIECSHFNGRCVSVTFDKTRYAPATRMHCFNQSLTID